MLPRFVKGGKCIAPSNSKDCKFVVSSVFSYQYFLTCGMTRYSMICKCYCLKRFNHKDNVGFTSIKTWGRLYLPRMSQNFCSVIGTRQAHLNVRYRKIKVPYFDRYLLQMNAMFERVQTFLDYLQAMSRGFNLNVVFYPLSRCKL